MNEFDKYKKNLACLIPSEKAQSKGWVVTSHEKTLCDCKVLEIISIAEKEISTLNEIIKIQGDALEFYCELFKGVEGCTNFDDGKIARQALTEVERVKENIK